MPSSRPSVAELRAVAQPPGLLDRHSGEHWVGRLYMRRLSPYLTRVALSLGISANGVTAIMIVVGLAGAALASVPHLAGAVAAVVLVQAYLLLDCSDGEVARWTGTTSVRGVYLDRLGHYLVEGSLLVAVGGRASDWEQPAWIAVGLLVGFLALLAKAETDLVDVARHREGLPPADDGFAVMKPPTLARGRRLAARLPVHRALHAIEASLLLLAAAIADALAGSLAFTRGLASGLLAVAAVVVVLHLVSVLSSRRLDRA